MIARPCRKTLQNRLGSPPQGVSRACDRDLVCKKGCQGCIPHARGLRAEWGRMGQECPTQAGDAVGCQNLRKPKIRSPHARGGCRARTQRERERARNAGHPTRPADPRHPYPLAKIASSRTLHARGDWDPRLAEQVGLNKFAPCARGAWVLLFSAAGVPSVRPTRAGDAGAIGSAEGVASRAPHARGMQCFFSPRSSESAPHAGAETGRE